MANLKTFERIKAFLEERGGMTFCDFSDYCMDNDKNAWLDYLMGPHGVLIANEMMRRGWDPAFTEEDIDDGIGAVAERYGQNSKIVNELYWLTHMGCLPDEHRKRASARKEMNDVE